MGDVGERPPGPWLADAAGEEAPLHAASCELQAVLDDGDQPEGNASDLQNQLLVQTIVPQSLNKVFSFQVPVNLLRAGRIFVFEPPPGVKANMLRTFSSIPVSRMCKVTAAGTMEHDRISLLNLDF